VELSLRVTILRVAVAGGVAVALSLAAVPGARPAAAGTAGQPVRGLDISAYQHDGTPINWGLLARQGVGFISVKVSEGTYYRNPYYPSDARAAAAAGIRVMPYAFANPGRSGGAATASFAVATVGAARAATGLPLVVDLENDPYKKGADCYGVGVAAMISWIAGFTGRAAALTGKWPVIYTTAAWWRECAGSTIRFRHDPLWLAAFGGTLPTVPSPWAHWTFWQYDNAGFLPGIGQTDLDYYQPTDGLPALRPSPASRRAGHKPRAAHKARPAQRHPGTAVKGKGKARHQPKPKKHKRHRPVSPSYPGKFQ
jgi:GH25 family lysozyme M1 (1,4-beta-N-acetylmuramidase)